MAERAASPQDRPAAPTPPAAKIEEAAPAAAQANSAEVPKSQDRIVDVGQIDEDPMAELLGRLEDVLPKVTELDSGLAQTIRALAEAGSDPERRSQPPFRHRVAYVMQDLERYPVGQIAMTPDLRSEMTRLAGAAPGLENERMLALMRSTGSIEDRSLVREIRMSGNDISCQTEQNSPAVLSRIDVLENKVRLTPRQTAPTQTSDGPGNPFQGRKAGTTQQAGGGQSASSELRAAEDTGPFARRYGGNGSQTTNQGQSRAQNVTYQRPILDTVLSGMRPTGHGFGAPWDPPPTPMAGRFTAFERKMTEAHDARVFARAMKSGQAALDALQSFENGEGAAVMNRIREAARSEPGGMPTVLSEMRDGGRFADLRRQFNNAVDSGIGLIKAYDKAATALGSYGTDRSTAQDIMSRRPDATAIAGRFEKLDAEIGEAASKIPSRDDGHSLMDDLVQKAAELLQKAVEAVKSALSRSPSTDATPRPSSRP